MNKCCSCNNEFNETDYPICEECFVKATRSKRTYIEEGGRLRAIEELKRIQKARARDLDIVWQGHEDYIETRIKELESER